MGRGRRRTEKRGADLDVLRVAGRERDREREKDNPIWAKIKIRKLFMVIV